MVDVRDNGVGSESKKRKQVGCSLLVCRAGSKRRIKRTRQRYLFWTFAFLVTNLSNNMLAADHLVPVEDYLTDRMPVRTAYRAAWQNQLLTCPANAVAQFVSLPGLTGVETAVSLCPVAGSENKYRLMTATASQRLWSYFAPAGKPPTASVKDVQINRCDAPIPDTLANMVYSVWLAILRQSRPEDSGGAIVLDSTREIFFATDKNGRQLRAQASADPGVNTLALIDLAFSLELYCEAPSHSKPQLAQQIQKKAEALLQRLPK